MKKKILFLITTLTGGGAEKILIETVSNLDKDKYDIEIKTILNRGIYINQIPQNVKYSYIFNDANVFSKIYFSFLLRMLKIIPSKIQYKMFIKNKYDIEIAYLEGAPTKLISGSYNTQSKKIAWVHVDPKILPYSRKAYLGLEQERKAYMCFDKICCVSSEVKKSLDSLFNTNEISIVQLNVLDEKEIIQKSLENIPEFLFKNDYLNLITIGRLAPQKNYQLLLKVCKKLKEQGYNFNLYILGDGLEKNLLSKYIKDNQLSNNVKLLGFLKNPYPYIIKCDMFVCSSVTEGFSTVVTESIILGVPVITTDCAGMKDIFGNSKCGIITENSFEGLYQGLLNVMNDDEVINNLNKNVKNRQQFFNLKCRLREIENIL